MLVQVGLCWTCSETTLLVFPRGSSYVCFLNVYSVNVSTLSDTCVIEKDGCLTKTFVEYIEGARMYLESESNGDLPILQEMRLHYSRFVRHLICNTPGTVITKTCPCNKQRFFSYKN